MKVLTKVLIWTVIIASLVTAAALLYGELPHAPAQVELTRKEFLWLKKNGNHIRYAPLPGSPPLDYIDANGEHQGLTSDYIREIERRIGVDFIEVQCGSWKEILKKLENHEIDMVGSVQNTRERKEFLCFTEPYQRVGNIILTRKARKGRFSLDTLQNMSVAVVDGSATLDYIREKHPEYNLIPVPDASTGFRMVSFNGTDAMVTDIGVASYTMEQLGISNLRVAGNIDYPWELCIASRKDWPHLNTILNKALATIDRTERETIKKRWITLDDNLYIPHDFYLRIIGIALLVTLLTIGSIIFWNRTLRKEVSRHSTELGQVRQRQELTSRALGESEERFRMLVESSNDMIWEMDLYGAYLYVSPKVQDILGYTPEELQGRNSLSLMIQMDSARNMEALRTCTANSVIDCEINTYIHKKGHRVILESSGRAFANANGHLAGFRGVSRDITERIESENALRQSEERFRNLVETTSDWIWEVDVEGRYRYASPQAAELLGYTAEELIGQHFTALMPPTEGLETTAQFESALAQGSPVHSLLTTNRHKSGRTVVLETSAVPFYDHNWNILGYRGISRNITDRVTTEKQLKFERNLFRSFMQHAPDLIYFKDAEGRFIEVNAAKAKELHLAPEDLIGRTDFDYLPEEQARIRFEDEQEVMRTRQPIKKEELASTAEGDRWYLTTKVPRYDEEGHVIGTFGTSWDITYRKLAEEQLRQLRALLSNTIDSMPSILVGVDAIGRVMQWNRQAEERTGLLPIDTLGAPLRKVYPELGREMSKVERAIRERKTQKEERIPVQHGGRMRYHDITVYPLLEGREEGAVIRIDDVTDRVMIEDSIRNIVEGVSTVGRSFFSSMVDQLAKTLGADLTYISEFIDDSRETMRTIAVSVRGESGENFDYELQNTPCEAVLQGENRVHFAEAPDLFPKIKLLQDMGVHSFIGIPLVDSEKQALGIMVALYRKPVEQADFAASILQVFAGRTAAELERLQATKELVALRNLLENIINSMPSIIIGLDSEGHVMQWNDQAEKLTGTDAQLAHGQPILQVFPDLGNDMNAIFKAMHQQDIQRHEHVHCTINAEPRIIDVTVYPITSDGSEGAVIRIDDVTDRVRIEEMMVQSEKMMSVGGLAAGMAHEINNPLAGILQNLQVMKNRVSDATERNTEAAEKAGTSFEAIHAYMKERDILQMMDTVSEAGRRAAKIVDNMLSFSRKDDAHFLPNDLAGIIERSIELASNDYNLKKRFDFRHIKIVREFENIPEIACEGSQIQQVLLNLLGNSAQAMAGNDRQKDPQITIRLKLEDKMVLIEVEDNGPGIDAETRKRVFEPFFTTKDVGHGTGLGLSVSYFIITENHNGTMNLSSSPGMGARFSIRIPHEHRVERWGLRL
ncbi:PAS domain S-box protein [Pontiella agarivorans]|uniref:histidine kinase n=1 Tax=Pontiella agarivorans TaxID=3038953 RepID=A0ABU5MXA7_9BACT|nr:PAS domain S-box protein [Pontiella agarivorans]MDZ8118711.1 PAS domain S-box protein [Pontiella agarivorans]